MNGISSMLDGREITQSVMALALLGAIIYLTVIGQEVPDTLQIAFATVLGFFFGAKVNNNSALG